MTCEYCRAPDRDDCTPGCPYRTLRETGDPGPLLHAVYWDGLEALLRDPGATAAAAELERERARGRRTHRWPRRRTGESSGP